MRYLLIFALLVTGCSGSLVQNSEADKKHTPKPHTWTCPVTVTATADNGVTHTQVIQVTEDISPCPAGSR